MRNSLDEILATYPKSASRDTIALLRQDIAILLQDHPSVASRLWLDRLL